MSLQKPNERKEMIMIKTDHRTYYLKFMKLFVYSSFEVIQRLITFGFRSKTVP